MTGRALKRRGASIVGRLHCEADQHEGIGRVQVGAFADDPLAELVHLRSPVGVTEIGVVDLVGESVNLRPRRRRIGDREHLLGRVRHRPILRARCDGAHSYRSGKPFRRGGTPILLSGWGMKSGGQLVKPNGQVTVASAVDVALAASLQSEAARRGITVSALMRELVTERLAEAERGEEQHRET